MAPEVEHEPSVELATQRVRPRARPASEHPPSGSDYSRPSRFESTNDPADTVTNHRWLDSSPPRPLTRDTPPDSNPRAQAEVKQRELTRLRGTSRSSGDRESRRSLRAISPSRALIQGAAVVGCPTGRGDPRFNWCTSEAGERSQTSPDRATQPPAPLRSAVVSAGRRTPHGAAGRSPLVLAGLTDARRTVASETTRSSAMRRTSELTSTPHSCDSRFQRRQVHPLGQQRAQLGGRREQFGGEHVGLLFAQVHERFEAGVVLRVGVSVRLASGPSTECKSR